MTLSCGSLFSGLGAFDLAFERAGFRVAWQCEIDPAARRVLAHHWPGVPCYGDITEVNPADLEPVDVVVFGSPCQDLSVAGKRAGMNGERSGLFHEAARVIRGLCPAPAMAVWENVAGALSSADGWDFAAVLDRLAECGALDICWRLLDGQYAGVAQRRRRVWVVADFGGQRAGEVLLESESLRGHPAAGREARERVAPCIAVGSRGSGITGQEADRGAFVLTEPIAGAISARQGKGPNTTLDDGALIIDEQNAAVVPMIGSLTSGMASNRGFSVASAITASAGHHGHSSPRGDGADNQVVSPALATKLHNTKANGAGKFYDDYAPSLQAGSPALAVAVSLRGRDGGATAELGGDASPALRASQGGGDKPHVLAFNWQSGGDCRINPTEDRTDTLHVGQTPPVSGPGMLVRRLMPVETLRLMGLPDDWLDGLALADSTKYRLVGNSLIVNEAEWIAWRVKAALRGDA